MYKYPDKSDIHFNNYLINADWNDGGLEWQYISESIHMIPSTQREIVLDVGCGGGGRLFKSYAPFFKKIIGVDADEERLIATKNAFEQLRKQITPSPQADFFLSFAENLEPKFFCNLIFCFHLIQHMRTDTISKLLSKLKNYLKDDGFLILATTNWILGTPKFSKADTIKHIDYILTEDEFNECVDQNNHFLPTRLFKDTELVNLLEQNNFEIIFLKKYHGYPKIRGDNFVFAKAK